MLKRLTEFFPPPSFLTRPAVGLDISDRSIKFVELGGRRDRPTWVRHGGVLLPPGAIEAGVIKDAKIVTQVLADLAKQEQLESVITALPEEQVYVLELDLPKVKTSQLRESIELSVGDYLRFPVAEAVLDFELLPDLRPDDAWLPAVATVLPLTVAKAYADVLLAAGLKPLAFELEPQALARALLPANRETTMIIDIGKVRTSFYIATNRVIRHSATIDTVSGDILTRALERQLEMLVSVAEASKIKHGLTGDGKVAAALNPTAVLLADEAEHRLMAWTHDSHQSLPRTEVKRIVLIGGQSTLAGLPAFLESRLNMPVVVGDPWKKYLSADELPPVPFNQLASLATAIGLALRNLW